MSVRVYLTGRLAVETPAGVIDEAAFPGRQARRAFVHLALSAQRPVAIDALADAVWGDQVPNSWEASLKSLVSKLRTVLVNTLEPFHESSYRLLMRAHALAGNRAEAIRTYNQCVHLLADELGVTPDPATVALGEEVGAARASPPARHGTLTIAVTDIVDSTRMASELGDERWNEVLNRHDAIMRSCIEARGGRVVKHLGDGLLVTFASTGDALDALAAAQERLAEFEGDAPKIQVRIGVHAGEPIAQDDDLFGLQVNIAARINALAGAAELLVSSVVRDLCPPGRFRFTGQRSERLKGISEPVTVFLATRASRDATS